LFSQLFAKPSDVRYLLIRFPSYHDPDFLVDQIGHPEWVRLLRPFTTVQMLWVCWFWVQNVALALEDVAGEMVAEVLPAFDLLFLASEEGPVPIMVPSIAKFDAARRLSGRPVTIIGSVCEFEERLKSYLSK